MSKSIRVVDGAPHAPTKATREKVCKMIACGLSPEEVGYILGLQVQDVKSHYAEEIEHGMAFVTAMVGGSLLKQALRGDVNAARFWLQSKARWTIPQHVELTGKDGGPIQVEARKKLIANVLQLAKGIRPSSTETLTEDPSPGSSVQ
jgi:hypothetical protein